MSIGRRNFLGAAAGALVLPAFDATAVSRADFRLPPTPQITGADTRDFWQKDRTLWLRREVHDHDRKKIKVEEYRTTYWSGGDIDVDNYVLLCYLLRDVNEDETVVMAPALLHLLYGITEWQSIVLGKPVPATILSGFRTEKTNASIEGAAPTSQHKHGLAADIKTLYYPHETIARQADFFRMGGVGRYTTHTHVDVAAVRNWDYRKGVPTHKRISP